MKGNFEFWNNYNFYVLNRIEKILRENRDYYLVDFHIHTQNSSDGEGTIREKLCRATELGMDIIAITDHDSINGYNEIYELFTNHRGFIDNSPILIAGIEYSVYYESYVGLCHVLQYFLNPFDIKTIKRLKKNKEAYWFRAKIQCERIRQNRVFISYLKNPNIILDFDGYKNFLKKNNWTYPDYSSLTDYICSTLLNNGITTLEIIEDFLKDIEMDSCEIRKNLRKNLFDDLMNRHDLLDFVNNHRLFTKIFAPLGIDDERYSFEKSIGSLSVEKYNQIYIQDLKDGFFILAHPDVTRLHLLIDEIPFLKTDICGYEINKRNRKSNIKDIQLSANQINYLLTLGSDSHLNNDDLYDDMGFYKYSKQQLYNFYKKSLDYIFNTKNSNIID